MSITAEVTFAEAAATGAGAVEAARGILRHAKACPWPDDAQARGSIHAAIWVLAGRLAVYDRLRVGIILPLDAIRGLGPGPGALRSALALVAEDVNADAGEVVRVIGETCGSEAAAKVRGSKGEQS